MATDFPTARRQQGPKDGDFGGRKVAFGLIAGDSAISAVTPYVANTLCTPLLHCLVIET